LFPGIPPVAELIVLRYGLRRYRSQENRRQESPRNSRRAPSLRGRLPWVRDRRPLPAALPAQGTGVSVRNGRSLEQ